MTLEPRTAIVTGAARRIGRCIAEALLADGWTVIAHCRRDGDPVPDGVIGVAAELSDPDCANRIFAAAEGHAPVRLLVNNAARFAPDSLVDFDSGELDRHMAVNLRAPVLLTQALAERHAGGDAVVVNLLDAKLSAPNADFLSYTLSKQALAGFTDVAARALAPAGIRVNGVAPALMLRSPGQDENNFAAMHACNPLGRGVGAADVIAALRYLVDAATVTGQVITIDGGHRFWSLPRDVQFLERT
ncbi:MAG TPA: SDR family oxidoreductase [Sphingomicrobium sp.]|nr:SDR family oxidoreductase [Sphingomicrobium sp.]